MKSSLKCPVVFTGFDYGGMDLYVYDFFHCVLLFELSIFPLIRSLLQSTSVLLFSFYSLRAFSKNFFWKIKKGFEWFLSGLGASLYISLWSYLQRLWAPLLQWAKISVWWEPIIEVLWYLVMELSQGSPIIMREVKQQNFVPLLHQ